MRRIIGCKAWFETMPSLRDAGKPVFRFENGTQPIVVVEGINTDFSGGKHFFMENNATRTLVSCRRRCHDRRPRPEN